MGQERTPQLSGRGRAARWVRAVAVPVCGALALTGCIVNPVRYGSVPHAAYLQGPSCPDDISPADEGAAAAGPHFLVTSRLPDCRDAQVSLTSHRSDRLRYGRFGEPVPDDAGPRIPLAMQQENAWWDALGAAAMANGGRVLLYVHGYRETFFTGARDTGQIARLAGGGAPAIHYSWPLQGEVLKYAADETNTVWDQRNFQRFLIRLSGAPWASDIVLVAHSLGARLALPALEAFGTETGANIRTIVLAAPDVDRQDFERDVGARLLSPEQVAAGRRITIYVSARDRALDLSYDLHGYPRLGRPDCFNPFKAKELRAAGHPVRCYPQAPATANPLQPPAMTVIDTTEVKRSRTGHSDYLKSAAACRDFAAVLRGTSPRSAERQRTRLPHVFTLAAPDATDYEAACLSAP